MAERKRLLRRDRDPDRQQTLQQRDGHRLDGFLGWAPLLMIRSVSRVTALSIGGMSAKSIGVRPRAFFSSSGTPLSARNWTTAQISCCVAIPPVPVTDACI